MFTAQRKTFLVSFVMLVCAGCADQPLPTETSRSGAQAASFSLADASLAAIDYRLTSFDFNTLALSGYSKLEGVCTQAQPGDPCRFLLTAPFTGGSRMIAARLDQYIPTDPCRTLAESYNVVVTTDGLYGVIAAMASQGCGARVLLDAQTASIRQFQPIALPPNPI